MNISLPTNGVIAGSPHHSTCIGQLRDCLTGTVHRLDKGRTVIGRQAATSRADIQLPPRDNSDTSREHLSINVVEEPLGIFTHYLTPFKPNIHPTYVNKELLLKDDIIALRHGDIIRLPDGNRLKFEMHDEELTGAC